MLFCNYWQIIQSLSKIFDHIQNINNLNIAKSVITDKDLSERGIIKNHFRNYVLLLWDRHVKRAFHEHIRNFQKVNINKWTPMNEKCFYFLSRDWLTKKIFTTLTLEEKPTRSINSLPYELKNIPWSINPF